MVASAGMSLAALFGRFLMGWPPEPLILPDDLRNCINKGKCVAFIGSGPSSFQYPSWPQFVNSLCERCGSTHCVQNDSPADDYLLAAEDAKICDEEAYYEHIGEQFGVPVTNIPVLYGALLRLPFRSYLTTNFDRLFVKAAELNHHGGEKQLWAYPNLDRINLNSGSIFYLHGIVQENESPTSIKIVLAQSEFEAAYEANSELTNFLIPTLTNDTVCFIGCRLREPPMRMVFKTYQQHQQRRIGSQRNGSKLPPPNYILSPRPVVSTEHARFDRGLSEKQLKKEERYYDDLGIKTVWYTPTDPSHSILQRAFEQLADIPSLTPTFGWEGTLK